MLKILKKFTKQKQSKDPSDKYFVREVKGFVGCLLDEMENEELYGKICVHIVRNKEGKSALVHFVGTEITLYKAPNSGWKEILKA